MHPQYASYFNGVRSVLLTQPARRSAPWRREYSDDPPKGTLWNAIARCTSLWPNWYVTWWTSAIVWIIIFGYPSTTAILGISLLFERLLSLPGFEKFYPGMNKRNSKMDSKDSGWYQHLVYHWSNIEWLSFFNWLHPEFIIITHGQLAATTLSSNTRSTVGEASTDGISWQLGECRQSQYYWLMLVRYGCWLVLVRWWL